MAEATGALTDRSFWVDYWSAKGTSLLVPVSPHYLFSKTLSRFLPQKAGLEFLEIGGFPGFYSVFFKKYYQYDVTLLDCYVDQQIVDELSTKNGLLPGSVQIIETDLFKLNTEKRFDVVMSAGFIEHFSDLAQVIDSHVKLLKEGGHLVIGVPNFLGLNGLVQKVFDRENYRAHNLDAMRLDLLVPLIRQAGIEIVHAEYEGRFGVWIEPSRSSGRLLQHGLAVLNGVGSRVLPFRTRLFSPYSLIIGKKR